VSTLEKEVEQKLRRMVQARGGLCLKWVCPGWAGVPDRILLLPRGRVIFVELKRPKGGIVSPLQKWWRSKLLQLGFDHYFIYNTEDVQDLDQLLRFEGAAR
jgi:hypothetical protein